MSENQKIEVRGHSGEIYEFEMRFFGTNNPEIEDDSGVYIFSKIKTSLGGKELIQRDYLYIGETESFRRRFKNHEKWGDAIDKGMQFILILSVTDEDRRKFIESDLINKHNPILNDK